MELFKNRNLALGCAGFLAFLFASYHMPLFVNIIIASLALCFIIVLFIIYLVKKNQTVKSLFIRFLALCLLLILAFSLSSFSFLKDKESAKALCNENEHTIVGQVDEIIYESKHRASYILSVSEVDGKKQDLKIILSEDIEKEATAPLNILSENTIINGNVVFNFLDKDELGYNESAAYLSEGIFIKARSVTYNSLQGEPTLNYYLRQANGFLDGILKEQLNADAYALTSAVFLGNRENLSYDVTRDYSRSGVVHFLSLSGMHISIIITIICFLISRLNLSKWLRFLFISLIVVLFIGITGFNPSALRAGIMQIIFFAFYFLKERADAITALFLSPVIICLISPYSIFSESLMLSFLAMLACFVSSKLMTKSSLGKKIKIKFFRYIIMTIITTLMVLAFTMPLTALLFGSFSIASIVTNVVLVPILNILLYLVPLLLVFSFVPYLNDAIAFLCEGITFISNTACKWISSLSFVSIPISSFIQWLGVILVFVALVLLVILSRKTKRIMLICTLVGVLVFVGGTVGLFIERGVDSSISVYSESNNDTIFIENDNKLTVIDASTNPYLLAPYYKMNELGYTEIESYIACDYNFKSANYINRLTSHAVVRNIYLPIPQDEKDSEYLSEVLEVLSERDTKLHYIDTKISLENIEIEFNERDYLSRSEKRAVSFTALINNVRLTYIGASCFELSGNFLMSYPSASDVIIFGSYGPPYHQNYYYNTKNLTCCYFLGDSYDFATDDFKEQINDKMVNSSHRVIIKP